MRFGVFLGNAQVEFARLDDKAVGADVKMPDFVVLFGIERFIFIDRKVSGQMHIIRIGAEASAVKWQLSKITADFAPLSMASKICTSVKIIAGRCPRETKVLNHNPTMG